MRRFVAVLLAVFAYAVLLCGCVDENTVTHNEIKKRSSTGQSWTVMIYVCGSDLEESGGRASKMLSSLPYDLPENINVILETGGCRSWEISDIKSDSLQTYAVQKNGIRLIRELGQSSMGQADTLSDFLSWSAQNYPAQHYMTVLWGNSGGPEDGFLYDTRYGYDALTTEELTAALDKADIHMDIIGFDMGLTSNLESASAVSDHADYMVASEDIMPENGWDYRELFELISDDPSITAKEVGAAVCDGIKANAARSEKDFVSAAVTELTLCDGITDALRELSLAASVIKDDVQMRKSILSVLSDAENFGANSVWEGYSDITDIRQLADALEPLMGENAKNLSDAVDAAVAYTCSGAYHTDTGGLGIYCPFGNTEKQEKLGKYKEFFEAFDLSAEEMSTEDNALTAVYDITGEYRLMADHPERITNIGVNIYVYDDKNEEYIFLMRDKNIDQNKSDDGYVYRFSRKLPSFNGTDVSMYLVSACDDYEIYSIPVIVSGDIRSMRAVRSRIDGDYTVIGLWKGKNKYNGMVWRGFEEIKKGSVITPIHEVLGNSDSRYIEGSPVKMSIGGVKLRDRRVHNGDYAISFVTEDIYGTRTESNITILTAFGGRFRTGTNQ